MSEQEDSQAEHVELGKTGIQISPLGLGTWQYGDRTVWDYGKGGFNDADLQAGFQHSLQAGINFFDSAESYGDGRSETLLGLFVRQTGQPVVIATKFMPFPWRLRRSSISKALTRSLKRLELHQVDLYQIHWPFPPMPVEHWAAGLAEAVSTGLARAVGVSNYNADQMRRAYDVLAKHNIPLASNQVNYSLFERTPERNQVLKTCRELGVTLIAYSPLAKGLLTGKYTAQNPMTGVRAGIYRGYVDKVQPLIGLMREIGQGHGGKTPAQVALNWLICQGTVPIPGAKNLSQAQENTGALGWRLTETEVETLHKAAVKVKS